MRDETLSCASQLLYRLSSSSKEACLVRPDTVCFGAVEMGAHEPPCDTRLLERQPAALRHIGVAQHSSQHRRAASKRRRAGGAACSRTRSFRRQAPEAGLLVTLVIEQIHRYAGAPPRSAPPRRVWTTGRADPPHASATTGERRVHAPERAHALREAGGVRPRAGQRW